MKQWYKKMVGVTVALLCITMVAACGSVGHKEEMFPDTERAPDGRTGQGGAALAEQVNQVGRGSELPQIFSEEESDDYMEAAEASRAFAADWFTALLDAGADENTIVSPYSAAMALSMTLRGADGATYEEIAQALGVSGLSEEEYLKQQALLIRHLTDRNEDVTLAVANSIWHAESMQADEGFIEQMKQYYGAEIAGVDFQDAETPKRMNEWVAQHTMGKIDSIVPDEIEGDPFMYLINALYLQAPWFEPFNKEHTVDEPFHLANGDAVQVPMMKRNGTMQAIAGDAYTAVKLPLGDEADLSMILILPGEGMGWEDIKPELASMDLRSFSAYHVELALPKFRLEQELDLVASFRALGMESMFDEAKSDLSRLASDGPGLFIDKALQKTYIEIDEEGLEAAAVTSMRAYPTSMPPSLSATFDRPFYFLIEEPESGVVLFIGAVRDPR